MKKRFNFKNIFISIILLILIFILIFFFSKLNCNLQNLYSKKLNSYDEKKYEISYDKKIIEKNWSLTIPKIGLYNAAISEGTQETVLDKFIGHFENTSTNEGNIGLAAHNRGYSVNYFAKVKELEIDDCIFYSYNKNNIKYNAKFKVILKKEIDSYDWSYLNKTDDNRLTLITCVEGKENKRLCVQAIEIKEE